MNVFKKIFNYNNEEIVTIKDYLKVFRKHKIYAFHFLSLFVIYLITLVPQFITGEWEVARNIILAIVYIIFEIINLMTCRNYICKMRKLDREFNRI